MTRTSRYLLLAVMLMCAGCARTRQDLNIDAMIPSGYAPVHQSRSTVAVYVPDEPNYFYPTVAVSFAWALRRSIERSGLFAHVVRDEPANFRLRAHIIKIGEKFGDLWTVWMEADYVLTRTDSMEIVWRQTIASNHYPLAEPRVRRAADAVEGAVRNNIEQAIREISQLRLE